VSSAFGKKPRLSSHKKSVSSSVANEEVTGFSAMPWGSASLYQLMQQAQQQSDLAHIINEPIFEVKKKRGKSQIRQAAP
jgi:hypothetical protein